MVRVGHVEDARSVVVGREGDGVHAGIPADPVRADERPDVEERTSGEVVVGDDPDQAALLNHVELRAGPRRLCQEARVLEPRQSLDADELGPERPPALRQDADRPGRDRHERGHDGFDLAAAEGYFPCCCWTWAFCCALPAWPMMSLGLIGTTLPWSFTRVCGGALEMRTTNSPSGTEPSAVTALALPWSPAATR